MKYEVPLLVFFLLFGVWSFPSYAMTECNAEHNQGEHRDAQIRKCTKGDVIIVYVDSMKSISFEHDVNIATVGRNEVGQYCSFEHQIVKLYEQEYSDLDGTKASWFNCIYRGSD